MKLKNKRTGETGTLIVDGAYNFVTNFAVEDDERNRLGKYNSIAELTEEWEDYEEPKKGWYIDLSCNDILIYEDICLSEGVAEKLKQIGNYFETKEEAELAVRKLKAWKRLKDKGFRFKGYTDDSGDLFSCQVIRCRFDDFGKESRKDLDSLFGGEE